MKNISCYSVNLLVNIPEAKTSTLVAPDMPKFVTDKVLPTVDVKLLQASVLITVRLLLLVTVPLDGILSWPEPILRPLGIAIVVPFHVVAKEVSVPIFNVAKLGLASVRRTEAACA